MALLFDTHCHLDEHRYPGELEQVIARAREAGVARMTAIGAAGDLATARHAIALAEQFDCIFASVGFHPHEASEVTDATLAELATLARHPRVVAVGEAGLDYHYDYSPREAQARVFVAQIELARAIGKPIVIHNRSSDEDCMRLLRENRAGEVGGVVHCFTSSWELARLALDLGFYLGFTGIVSFKNGENVREILAKAPRDRIVVETDSPFLAPLPFRGQRNEPARVREVAGWVEKALGEEPGALTELLWQNAHALYRLPLPEGLAVRTA